MTDMVKDDAALEKFQDIQKFVIYLDARQLMMSEEDKLVTVPCVVVHGYFSIS